MKLFKRKKVTAVLEIGKIYLKLAIVEESKKNKTITKLIKKDLTDKKNIAEILNQNIFPYLVGIDRVNLIVVLSRDQATIRNLELPTTDPQEIKDIISIQAGKQTPFSKDEIIADFKTIGLTRQHYTKVLLAIIQKTVINSYLNNLAEKKNAVQKIVLSSECLVNWYPFIQHKIKDETFAILDFDLDSCDFCVLSKGKLLCTKLLPFGIHNLSKKGWQKSFSKETKLFLSTYRKEDIGPVFNKVVFIDKAPDKNLKDVLAKQFSLEAFGPFKDMEDVGALGNSTLKVGPHLSINSFFKLIGLTLNPDECLMDFLPQNLKQARQRRIKKKEFTITGVLILLIFIAGLGIFAEKIYTKTLLLKKLDVQLIKLEKETSELKKEDLKIKLIGNRVNAKNSAIEVLRQVHKVVPQGIYLTAISFDENKKLVFLRGTSISISEVFKFVKNLKELSIFRDAKTKYVTKRKLKGKDFTDFEIKLGIENRG